MSLSFLLLIVFCGSGAVVAHRQGKRRASITAGVVCVLLVIVTIVLFLDSTGVHVQ